MKPSIHPAYIVKCAHCACGNAFTTRSTHKGDISVEICARLPARSLRASRSCWIPLAASSVSAANTPKSDAAKADAAKDGNREEAENRLRRSDQ
mgnify:CR=1 FL=1